MPYHLAMSPYKTFNDPNQIRTGVTAVKGRCLNRLTMGPNARAVAPVSSPSRTRTYDSAVNSRVLYRLSYRGRLPNSPATKDIIQILENRVKNFLLPGTIFPNFSPRFPRIPQIPLPGSPPISVSPDFSAVPPQNNGADFPRRSLQSGRPSPEYEDRPPYAG